MKFYIAKFKYPKLKKNSVIAIIMQENKKKTPEVFFAPPFFL